MDVVAVVTGASSGIGFGTALKLRDMGFAVLGTGRSADKLADLRAAFANEDRIGTVAVDITAEDAPKRIVDTAVARWGKIDFLINNAGIGRPMPVDEATDENFDTFLNIMLRAPFRLIREALPHMPRGSCIINVTSTHALVGGFRAGPYAAAKAGMHGLTSHIACQYGASGIRANCVAPGVIPTPMTEGRWENDVFQKMNNHMTPHHRMGTVDDVASTIAFLCTPGAGFINGQTIAVDGGWSATKYLSDFARTSKWISADA